MTADDVKIAGVALLFIGFGILVAGALHAMDAGEKFIAGVAAVAISVGFALAVLGESK